MILAFFCGLFFVGMGVIYIFARDLAWEFTEFGNSLRGIHSERTGHWDAYAAFSGVLMLLFGGGILLLSIAASVKESNDSANATATVTSRFSALESAFAPHIPALRENAQAEPQFINAASLAGDLDASVAYGLCRGDSFYLVIDNPGADDGFYAERGANQSCVPAAWVTLRVRELGRSSAGGRWYGADLMSFSTRLPPRTPRPTATPTPSA